MAVDGRCSTCCAGPRRTARLRSHRSRRTRSSPPSPFLGHRPPVVTRAEFRPVRLHPGPPRRRAVQRLPHDLDPGGRGPSAARGGRAVRLRLLRGHRQGRPRVRAGRPLRRRAAGYVDRLVADLIEVLPPRRGARHHLRPRPGRRGRQPHHPGPPTCSSQVSYPVGRGPLPLAARPSRAGPTPCSRRPRPTTATTAWVVSQEQIDRRAAGSGRRSPTPARRRLGDVALVAREPVAFVDPDDTGPFELIGRHGSLTSAEMRVPLLATRRLNGGFGSLASPGRPGKDASMTDAPDRIAAPPRARRARRRSPAPADGEAERPRRSATSSCPSRPRSCGSAR